MPTLRDNGLRGSKVLKVKSIKNSDWYEEKPDWWKHCFESAADKELYHIRHKHWDLLGDELIIPIRHPDSGIGTNNIKIPKKFLDLTIENRNPS
jgi:hypothetical protein